MLGTGGLALIVAAVALLSSGSDQVVKPPPPAKLPALREAYANPAMGASGLLPAGWSAVKGRGLLRLSDPSGRAVIVVAAVDAGRRTPLLRTSLASIRRTYRGANIKHGSGTRLGGLPARSIVLYARNTHRVPLRILLAVAQARRRAYVVEAFTARSATVTQLAETQEAITYLRLR